jgi:transcriptional regulator with PAS, ATPase and Fis domain
MEVFFMADLRDLLVNILGNLSDAAAIINQGGVVLYANKAFEERFSLNDGIIRRGKALRTLDLGVTFGKEALPLEELFLPNGLESYAMNVYLLDDPQRGDHHYLLLPKPDMNIGDDKASGLPFPVKSQINKEKLHAEVLSPEFKGLIGEDPSFKRALLIAQKAAKADLPVLILGESGTGKEIVARAIHRTSQRSNKPLVDVNCAAIPDTLIESELFGYEKGAFTGARTEGRSGYFEAAHGGTLLMDEIGDASLQSQSKLLRVLEDGCFKRVGGNRNVKVDVRIISSTNKDLRKNITEKTFREDLFYRLNTFSIQVPPLRDRTRDIPLLVEHFLASNVISEYRRRKFLPSCMEIICAYHWPGNVRELKGVVNYAVNMSSGATIDPSALPSFLFSQATQSKSDMSEAAISIPGQASHLGEILEYVERDLIKEAMAKSANRSEAIKRLGISRRTFYIKIKQYGLA